MNRVSFPLAARHRPSGVSVQPQSDESFADYMARVQRLLAQVHADQPDSARRVAGNAPFELLPRQEDGCGRRYRRGVLLVHGLSDCPYHLKHIGALLREEGFYVLAVLLPGHGTQPGDLLWVDWKQWAQTVAFGVAALACRVEEIYLAGYSAGAALSLHHAAHDPRVRGLFLFAPALAITPRARWANLHRLWSWALPRTAWLNVLPDEDTYKYESFCKNAAAQMYALTRALPQTLPLPIFAAASADDATVDVAALLAFMARAPHPANRLVWYARRNPQRARVDWVDSYLPQQRILSFAHTSIVMPPDDPHYGAHGDYANCLHYAHDAARFAACRAAATPWYGEIGLIAPDGVPVRRLTFNPHFAALQMTLRQFIRELP
ncbi:MAG: alpha/beta fold hydrolase [Sideroxydans sp.]